MADTAHDNFDPDGIVADETKMPLLEHLLELRTRLIYCFVALIVMFFIAYGFSGHVRQLPLHRHAVLEVRGAGPVQA